MFSVSVLPFSYGRSQVLGSFVPYPCVPVTRHGLKHRPPLYRQSQPKVNPPDGPGSSPPSMQSLLGDSVSVDDDSSSDERSSMNARSNRRPSPHAGTIGKRTPSPLTPSSRTHFDLFNSANWPIHNYESIPTDLRGKNSLERSGSR